MKYKGEDAPDTSGTSGVKQRERGQHRGKWQAFYRSGQGHVFTGEYRNTRAEAMFDLSALKSRIYI